MNRFYILILVLFLLSGVCKGQQNSRIISGIIKDSFGEVIIGAQIIIEDKTVTFTDKHGKFTITQNDTSSNIKIQYLGFEDKIVVLPRSSTHVVLDDIIITPKSTILREVNISSTALTYRADYKTNNYYVSPLQIKRMQPISTEEVLKTLPGVNVLGDMGLGNRANVSIRGSWGRRSEKVLMMEDGSPISPAPYIAPGIYYNPISERIDGIEVYTGADILRYGPNNMYGIINYFTAKPPQEARLRMKVTGGQNGYFAGLISYGGTWKKVGSQVEAVYKKFDGFTQNSSLNMVNLSSKIFAELSENQSLYFKIGGQFEDNQTSLSSITPYTFKIDPRQNPFDADRFTMHRYGLDIIHKWVSTDDKLNLTSKIFASDFARDWWRQTNIVIPAQNVRAYVGEQIFSQKYAYLNDQTYDPNAYVRVGRINGGRESTTDSRWHFTVASIEQTFQKKWQLDEKWKNQFEIQGKVYYETYKDRVIAADSSRWARSGRFTADLAYSLISYSSYIRNQLTFKNLEITPILRFENVSMNKDNRLQKALDPNLNSDKDLVQINNYSILQPGFSINYRIKRFTTFASTYKGYIAPSKYFGFLVERDGVLVNPVSPSELSNVKPEKSINTEVGVRGELYKNIFSGQIAVFSNKISNFYLAGWNEFFNRLATIDLKGLEAALKINLTHTASIHKLSLVPNITLLQSRVTSGLLVDRHLFTQTIHNDATKKEFVDKVNANPLGYKVFISGVGGQVQQLSLPITTDDVDRIVRTEYYFGSEGIKKGVSPYSPEVAFNFAINYGYKSLGMSFSYNYVGSQYAEFANFENESDDGSIGKIPAFSTYDLNLMYDFSISKTKASFFVSGKNLGNQIFVASRLNRGQSGIMPGGFRQINAGLSLDF